MDIHEAHSIFAIFHFTTADVGPHERADLSIEHLHFEPAEHTIAVRFALPVPARGRLELFDTTGRLQAGRAVGDLGPGVHEVRLGAGGRLAPGLYFVRLRRGDRAATARVVVVY